MIKNRVSIITITIININKKIISKFINNYNNILNIMTELLKICFFFISN